MLARQLAEEYEEYEEYYQELPAQEQKVIRQKAVIRQNAATNNSLRIKIAVCIMVFSLLWGVVLVRSSMLASQGYELGKIQQEASRLEKENAQLQIDNAKMKSPARIKAIAANELGMTFPQETYFAGEQKKN